MDDMCTSFRCGSVSFWFAEIEGRSSGEKDLRQIPHWRLLHCPAGIYGAVYIFIVLWSNPRNYLYTYKIYLNPNIIVCCIIGVCVGVLNAAIEVMCTYI